MPPKRKAPASTEDARSKRIRSTPSSDTIAVYPSTASASSSFRETPDPTTAPAARRPPRRAAAKKKSEDIADSIAVQPAKTSTRGRPKKTQEANSAEPRPLAKKHDLNGAKKGPAPKTTGVETNTGTETENTTAAGGRKGVAQSKPKPAVEAAPSKDRDIWDIPSSEDELSQPTTAGLRATKKPATQNSKAANDESKPAPAKTSRARGSRQAKSEQAKEEETSQPPPSPPTKPVRRGAKKATPLPKATKAKPTKSHQTEPTNDEDEVAADSTIVVGTNKPKPPTQKPAQQSRRRQQSDDEDIIVANGIITPAPSQKPHVDPRFSLGTEGVQDPFAMHVANTMDIDEPATTASPKKTLKTTSTPASKPKLNPISLPADLELTSSDVTTLQHHILSKLTARIPIPLTGLDEEYDTVHQLLSQTVTAGESNSLLLIGSRGSGKSALLSTAISSLQSSNPGEFYTVRLSGLLQTDDRLAIREIYRQLGQELNFDADAPGSFADTLSKLLAMLSHPDELNPDGGDEEAPDGEEPHKTATAVVFILEEFDLFASHPRQTLLYNLFDIAQSRKAPIAVIGCTTTIEILDRLEKRVKSRFSHRVVHCKLPESIEQFWGIVKGALEAPEIGDGGDQRKRYYEAWNNEWIDGLRQDPGFDKLLKREFAFTRQLARVLNSLLPAVASVSVSQPFPPIPLFSPPPATTASAITAAPPLAPPSSNLSLLSSLSDLQLSLLISAARLEVLADAETVNWGMVYDEYLQVCSKMAGTAAVVKRVWGKSVARKEWEGVEKAGLVMRVGGGRGGGNGGEGSQGGLWRVEVGLKEVGEVLGTQWRRWCREVV